MDHATFTRTPAERAGLPEETAEQVEHANSERGDVDPDEARTGAAAVLATVRDAVEPGKFHDVLAQLPQEYRELVGPMA